MRSATVCMFRLIRSISFKLSGRYRIVQIDSQLLDFARLLKASPNVSELNLLDYHSLRFLLVDE